MSLTYKEMQKECFIKTNIDKKLNIIKDGNKYHRTVKGIDDNIALIDVYCVLKAFNVTNPALQHLIKKALCVGLRGHKDINEDLDNIVESAIRAKELEDDQT